LQKEHIAFLALLPLSPQHNPVHFSIRVSFFSAKTTTTTTTTELHSPSHEIALRFSIANTLSQYRKESQCMFI